MDKREKQEVEKSTEQKKKDRLGKTEYWKWVFAVICCAEAIVKGTLAYAERSAIYAILAVLWLACAALYVGIVRDEW